jgi:hypothetical protein
MIVPGEGYIEKKEWRVSFATGVDGSIYYSYLLRIWQVPSNGGHTWRIQLENVQTGEKCGFTNLEELLAYLSQVTLQENSTSGEGS